MFVNLDSVLSEMLVKKISILVSTASSCMHLGTNKAIISHKVEERVNLVRLE